MAFFAQNAARDELDRPLLIEVGFTFTLHDRPGDAMHALAGMRAARQNRERDLRELLGTG